ncbi:MAG TPA: class I SAM-dependent methyltransferase [Spirochaetota bacterium]|nr:class I SAM-dependent methyltransferase [Spirochaetota bacterium]HPP04050.1 class I SAM-dependent methyltransferase [Spirochaetota bacterium]
MLKKLKNYYYKKQFNPGIIGIFINPFYFSRKELYKNISKLSKHINGKILDIGCGIKPYQHLFNYEEYIGLEWDTEENRRLKKADFFYDGKDFPFENETFDSIISTQVLEHIFEPEIFLKEMNRILKPNGNILLSLPLTGQEHEQPFDYGRYTSFGIKYLLEKNGFSIIELKKSACGLKAIFQLINDYIYRITSTRIRILDIIIRFFLITPVNIIGSILSFILPRNQDIYLDNVVVAKKIRGA